MKPDPKKMAKAARKLARARSLASLKNGTAPRAKSWGGKPSSKTVRRAAKKEMRELNMSYEPLWQNIKEIRSSFLIEKFEPQKSGATRPRSKNHVYFDGNNEYFYKNDKLFVVPIANIINTISKQRNGAVPAGANIPKHVAIRWKTIQSRLRVNATKEQLKSNEVKTRLAQKAAHTSDAAKRKEELKKQTKNSKPVGTKTVKLVKPKSVG